MGEKDRVADGIKVLLDMVGKVVENLRGFVFKRVFVLNCDAVVGTGADGNKQGFMGRALERE
jgi:hypothetical protein